MRILKHAIFCLVFIIIMTPSVSRPEETDVFRKVITHNLKVTFYPEERRFTAEDTVSVPEHLLPECRFFLHRGLNPSSPTTDAVLSVNPGAGPDMPHESYTVQLPPGINTFVLKYGGTLNNPSLQGKKHIQSLIQAQGTISEAGVYLSGSSLWYPVFNGEFVKFNLLVELPSDWDAVSQGDRTLRRKDFSTTYVKWESNEPQEEIFLIASRFIEYSQSTGKVMAMVFLRTPDKGLADKYLEATVRYINMYESLIGPYPYKKFALVENIWESGIGVPSFTLIGPKIIRLPFVLNSSYLHEVLHTWWGNSIFPDYERGNWSEGLTAYLSDHLMKEQQEEGAAYRLRVLQRYSEHVSVNKDSPLSAFRMRTGSFAEAIGYGKSLMFFHMLRLQVGDKAFTEGLRDFYQKKRFRRASFADILKSLETVSGRDLKKELDQWVTKPGAPRLRVTNVRATKEQDRYVLSAVLEQKQHGKFNLNVPVAVTMEGQEKAYQTTIRAEKKRVEFKISLPYRPLRLDIDPEFDIFRRLERDEIPPVISQITGSGKILIILPSSANSRLLQAYRQLSRIFTTSETDEIEIRLDSEITSFPQDCSVVVMGAENRFAARIFNSLSRYKVILNQRSVRIGRTEVPLENNSMVFTSRNPENEDMGAMFVFTNVPESIPELGRNILRYSRFSYAGFEGKEAVSTIKGTWNLIASPLTVFIPDEKGEISSVETGELAPRKPLITPQTIFSEEAMMQTIRYLTSEELKGRGLGTEELDKSAQYIAKKFQEAGLKPAGDGGKSFLQTFEAWSLGEKQSDLVMKNVVGVIPGKKPDSVEESIVLGAHYDHLGIECGRIKEDGMETYCPGANDNASGVAVLIELARVLNRSLNPDRTIIFAAFTNEEKGKHGSRYFVDNMKDYPADKCTGMINIDTVGQIKKNRIFILNSSSAKEWQNIFRGASSNIGLDIDFVTEDLDVSDQINFHNSGIPAVQLFSGPHADYHQETDTADKINSSGLVKTALLLKMAVENLSSHEDPLTFTGRIDPRADKRIRRKNINFGIIPDSDFERGGSRVFSLMPGSSADMQGMKEGDIIIRVNSSLINSHTNLVDVLNKYKPGDEVEVTFLREGYERTVKVVLTEM